VGRLEKKVAVITGAASGIGRATALRLAESGWQVFAGVRRAQDGEDLAQGRAGAITPVILDVTDSDQVDALAGVDLVIEDGEWLAIQGPTGHGKTTLLQVLGGLDRPTSGIVEFDGHDLAAHIDTAIRCGRAAYAVLHAITTA